MKPKSEEFVRLVFEKNRFLVKKLRVQKHRQPDFVVNDGTYTYLIEVKSKFPSQKKSNDREKQLSLYKSYTEKGRIAYNNTISGILRDAIDQLNTTTHTADFKIIWMLAEGYDSNVKLEMIRSTLYGIARIIDLDDIKFNKACLYFYNSEFLHAGDRIDAVIISSYQNGLICLNAFSSRYNELRVSRLCRGLGIHVLDPVLAESKGVVLSAANQNFRKHGDVPFRYIQKKYHRPHLTYTENEYFRGEIAVSTEDLISIQEEH